MKTLSNKIITSALIASMLLPNAAVASMHEPTTMDNLDEIVTMAQSHSEGVPTPYADISNPGKKLTTADIEKNNGGVFIDSRLPKNEWLSNVIVVHQNEHIGNLDVTSYKENIPSLFSDYPGWDVMSNDKVTLGKASLQLSSMLKKSLDNDIDMSADTMKNHKSQIVNAMVSKSRITAKWTAEQISQMPTKDGNVVNINEDKSITVNELLNFTSPEHYEGVARYLRAGWLIHEIGHSDPHQDDIHNGLVHSTIDGTSSYQAMSMGLINQEVHSDAQMLLAVQTTMLKNNEPSTLIDAYFDTIVRMRESNIAKYNLDQIKSTSYALPIEVDISTHDITLEDPSMRGADAALLTRPNHDTTLGLYAIKSLLDANPEQAKKWDDAMRDNVMSAFVHALDDSDVVQDIIKSERELTFFSKMNNAEFTATALAISKSMAATLHLNAPSDISLTAPLKNDVEMHLKNGFKEVEGSSLFHPRAPVKNALVFDGGEGPIKTAMITPTSATRKHERLLIPLSNNDATLEEATRVRSALDTKLKENGITAIHMSTPMESEHDPSSSLLLITLRTPEKASVAMTVVSEWLNDMSTSPSPAYEGGHFALNKRTASVFDHTYLATLDYEGIDADSYAKEVLLQSFGDSMTLFDAPSPHEASQNTPELDAALQHKLSR